VGLDLVVLLCNELLSQALPEARLVTGGPRIRIAPRYAVPLALTFHELSINALTHGAFASSTGEAEIRWSVLIENGTSWLRVGWNESGFELPADSLQHKGFGFELIERMLPYELNARTSVRAVPEGLRVQLDIPALSDTPVWRLAAEPRSWREAL
jgi:two-component system CheB/CheR fusion protein